MADKIKVLQLIESWGPGGAEKVVLELARGMDRNYFQPVAGLLHTGWLQQQLEHHGVETVLFKNNRSFDPHFLWKLVKIVRERSIDLIHAHEFTMNVYGALAAYLTRNASVATVHGNKYFPDRKRRRAAYRIIARLPNNELVTVSKFLKGSFCRITGVNAARVRIIHNGVDCTRFSRFSSSGINDISKIIPGKPLIGTIGNLYPGKGHIYLIRAASLVAARFPGARILIIGKRTEYQSCLEDEAARLNIGGKIKFLGFQEDVTLFLKQLDLFVLPSLQETFSIALIEAMATGLPVIATRCGGPEEIIMDGVNGFLVPPQDHKALAEKMLLLLDNEGIGREMARKGRENIMNDYTIEKMISDYQQIYLQVQNRKQVQA